MKNLIIFLIFLFSNCFYSQELNKIEIDAYVNTFSKRDFGEINEGYLGNKAYDWVESGEAGKFVDKTVKNISKGVNSLKNKAGEIFSGFGKSLGSAFG